VTGPVGARGLARIDGMPALRSRIQVPQLPEGVIERQGLLDRLDAALHHGRGVVLVRAAAGFGKTTLLAQWAHRAAALGRPVAWMTCEERTDDPAALFVDLRDALALALAESAPRASAQLMELAVPSARSSGSELEALLMLLDDLATAPALVLDDLQAIRSGPCRALLESLALGLPPGVGLALGSRVVPPALLTALRLRTRVAEVSEVHLALTRAEVAQVVGEAGGDPGGLTDPLLAQTEGWPAAVRLGVLAAPGAGPGHATGVQLSHDPAMSDFLTREIEAALPGDALALLRATAVVPELSPRLAAALAGRPDAGAILERLFRTQALVRRTGGDEPTYVVHTLLREHLLAALAAADVDAPARQHAQAAHWLAEAGFPERALDHAVAARDAELTAVLLRRRGPQLLVAGRVSALLEALATIPSDHRDPDLVGLGALARAAQGDLVGARGALLRGAALAVRDPGAAGGGAPAMPSLLRVAEFHVRRLAGSPQAPDIPVAFADVLAWPADPAPREEDLDRQLVLLVSRGQWEFATGQYDASWADLRLALDLATTHRRDHVMLLAMSTLSAVPALVGDAATVDRYAGEVLRRIEERGWATHPAMANVYAAGAWSASLMLLPERAEQLIGLARGALLGNVDPEYATYTALVDDTLLATRGDDPAPALARLARFAQAGPSAELTPALRAFPAMQRVRILLARGDLAGAQEAAADFGRWYPGTGDWMIARAEVRAARGLWEQCLTDLRSVTERSMPVTVPVYDIVAPMLESVAEERLGRRSAARGALLRALAVAAPRGVVRPFWEAGPTMRGMLERQRGRFGVHDDFVATILQRWDALDAQPGGLPRLAAVDGVALTPRELEVLRALPSLMTADELAAAQTVSVNTVRTHMRSLYRKLGVRTRRDAVRRGRELGLL
jgi:LuxR family transcriptional regulator, maltose regulon positive regulatory protein